jgi:hypothetical protein
MSQQEIMDLREYLDQGEIWITAGPRSGESGPTLKIKEMDIEHRRKAARWLMNRAQALITVVECQTNEGVVSDDGDSLRDVLSLIAQDPRYWIRNTALFRALVSDLPMRPVVDI